METSQNGTDLNDLYHKYDDVETDENSPKSDHPVFVQKIIQEIMPKFINENEVLNKIQQDPKIEQPSSNIVCLNDLF